MRRIFFLFRYDAAVENFECALEHCEEDGADEDDEETARFRVHHRLAQCHAKTKNFSRAVEALEESVRCLADTAAASAKAKEAFTKLLVQCADKFRSA